MRCSDSLTSIPPHFVAFVWQYRVCARYSLPGEGSAPSWVLGLFTGCPPGIERGEIRASQVPGGPPCMRAPLCDPDRPPASGQSWRERCCLPPGSRRRPRQFGSYEAESRGPHARCLRFAASVTRNATQDSLPAGGQPLLGGILARRVPSKGFKSRHGLPPFPSFAWRTNHRSIWASSGHRLVRFFGGA